MDPLVLEHAVPEDWRAQAGVFEDLFFTFLVIGTVVGFVVVAYTLYHAYKGRDTGATPADFDPPTVGELPVGQTGPKSRKLFLSFGISAVIVISLVTYSYMLLLYVEQGPSTDVQVDGDQDVEEMEIQIIAFHPGWEFVYPNGESTINELRVPQNTLVRLSVTSEDVWHNFGVPELRVKADAIPGQESNTWFYAEEPDEYRANCYELCGPGHSYMNADVIVMEESAFDDWYAGITEDDNGGENTNSTDARVDTVSPGVTA